MNSTHRNDNIIRLPRHRSVRHSPMSNFDRAAQFAPFAALTGYDAVIAETARLTDTQIELDEGGKALLDEKLQTLREHLGEKPPVTLQVFCPDIYKSGGAYETVRGHVKKIDPVARCLVMTEGDIIPIDRIYGIDCCQFPGEVL
ncbi:MAG: hypothetical protein IKK72_05090 [Oscillospiraceae bacterium]|nr:hypothetical protein [Oscillospiraceae bacterium]